MQEEQYAYESAWGPITAAPFQGLHDTSLEHEPGEPGQYDSDPEVGGTAEEHAPKHMSYAPGVSGCGEANLPYQLELVRRWMKTWPAMSTIWPLTSSRTP